MNKNTTLIIAIVLIVAAGVGGFFAGLQYQKSQPRGNGQFAGRSGANGQGFAGRFGGVNGGNFAPLRGQVLSIGNNSVTIKQTDGTTKIVVLSSNTVFVQSQKTSENDLKTGDTVNVIGTQNSDGSVTASDVQINPVQMQRGTQPTQGTAQ